MDEVENRESSLASTYVALSARVGLALCQVAPKRESMVANLIQRRGSLNVRGKNGPWMSFSILCRSREAAMHMIVGKSRYQRRIDKTLSHIPPSTSIDIEMRTLSYQNLG